MEWVIEGEDVLVQVHAVFNKQQGTLFVTNKRVAYSQTSAQSPSISLPVSFLKGGPKRNVGGDRCLLRFGLKQKVKDQSDFTFEFTQASKDTDRDSVLELVNELIKSSEKKAQEVPKEKTVVVDPMEKRKMKETRGQKAVREAGEGLSGGDVRARATALAGDPALRSLYNELVKTGVISEEEFWHNRQSDLDKYKAATSSTVTGNPSNHCFVVSLLCSFFAHTVVSFAVQIIADVKPALVRPGEVHYRLTAATIRQIFAENPAVKRAYDDNVPHKKTEEEFWKAYLQSKYVESASNKPKHSVVGDIFAKAEADLEKEEKESIKANTQISFDLDMRNGEGEYDVNYEDAEEPAQLQSVGLSANVESVIDKFNSHSASVLAKTSVKRYGEYDLEGNVKKKQNKRKALNVCLL